MVREHVDDPARERVELREGVLADGDQHVRARRAAQELGQLRDERAGRVGRLVVDEVLLELIEDQVRLHVVVEPAEGPCRIAGPRVVDDHVRLWRDAA